MKYFLEIRSLISGAVLASGLLLASLAQAHTSLIESVPAADAQVAAPEQIDLVFNERLVTRASRLELNILGDQGTDEKVEHFDLEFINDGKTLRAKLQQPLAAGLYRVAWHAVGNDNHPVTGEFSFTVSE